MAEADQLCPSCGDAVPTGVLACPRDGTLLDQAGSGTLVRDPLIGRQLGEYVAQRRIGAGGMGLVYEAVHPLIGKRAAVKILRPEMAEDPEQMARLLSEARAVASIHHRAVVGIFGFGELPDGRHYMVMEYLEGEPLDAYLQREGKLPLDEVLSLLDEVLAGLAAAHGVGVIHRDLKPSNVFLRAQPDGSHELKVLDFGLAKQASRPNDTTPQTNAHRVLGTPDYMAPEQARGRDVGPRTDLYALGVMAFEMATGRRPFVGESLVELLLQHANEPPPRPSSLEPSLPAGFDELVLALLSKRPEDRPATADEVRRLLAGLREPEPPGKPKRPRKTQSEVRPVRLATPRAAANPLPASPASVAEALGATHNRLEEVGGQTHQQLSPIVEGPTIIAPAPEAPEPVAKAPAVKRAAARGAPARTEVTAPALETSEPAPPPPQRSWAPLVAVLSVLGLAIGVGVVARSIEAPPQAVEVRVQEPVTPPFVAPLEPLPVEVTPPVEPVAPVEPMAEPRPPEPVPDKPQPTPRPVTAAVNDPTSAAALRARAADLSRRLGPGDAMARAFLETLRKEIKPTSSLATRRQIALDLDEWESRYLKGH